MIAPVARAVDERPEIGRLRRMMLIRAFEAALASRRDHGFQLLSTGQEGTAVGVCASLEANDQLLSGGRSIGPALARGVEPGRLMAELLGKASGTNRGKGGRGHVADPDAGFFGAHAVVGGNISIAAGVALAKKFDRAGEIVVVFFGDGATGAGALHETLNMAAIWKLPMLFVCDNNQLSVSTARADVLAPARLSDLGSAFGLASQTVDGTDVERVAATSSAAIRAIRNGAGPMFLECISYRFEKHSTTARELRSNGELRDARTHCPIERQFASLAAAGILGEGGRESLEREVAAAVSAALAFADASPYPEPGEVLTDVD
jgi:TPP-dependent pyruvate/acetoin dehydrogenase alpha subunit